MEKWSKVFESIIPLGVYQSSIIYNNQVGLCIRLENSFNVVNINFNSVTSFRILDEGIILGGLFNEKEITLLKEDHFSNSIYQINGGEYSEFIKKVGKELYEFLGLKHYIIVTENTIIEVITKWNPEIDLE